MWPPTGAYTPAAYGRPRVEPRCLTEGNRSWWALQPACTLRETTEASAACLNSHPSHHQPRSVAHPPALPGSPRSPAGTQLAPPSHIARTTSSGIVQAAHTAPCVHWKRPRSELLNPDSTIPGTSVRRQITTVRRLSGGVRCGVTFSLLPRCLSYPLRALRPVMASMLPLMADHTEYCTVYPSTRASRAMSHQ